MFVCDVEVEQCYCCLSNSTFIIPTLCHSKTFRQRREASQHPRSDFSRLDIRISCKIKLSALIFVYKLFLDLRSHNFVLVDLTELGIDYIDVVVLSIPPFLNADTQFDIIKPMWKVFSFYTALLTLLLILCSVSIARISTTNI